MKIKFLVIACALGLVGGVRAADLPLVHPIDSDPFPGRLAGVDDSGNYSFESADGLIEIAADDLYRWGSYREREGKPLVLLVDGSVLAADVEGVTRSSVAVRPRLLQPIELPIEKVRGVILHPPADKLERDRLMFGLQNATGSQDELLLRNGDRISGLLVQPAEDTEARTFRLETSSDQFTVAREKVAAVRFNPALLDSAAVTATPTWLGLRDGGLLAVSRIIPEPRKIQFQLACDITLSSFPGRLQRLWSDIEFVQTQSPRVRYLSGLKPLDGGYKPVAFLESTWPYETNRNVLGGRLRSGGDVHLSGIGMHSASRLAYALPAGYKFFVADLAIDDAAGARGSVQFQVVINRGSGWRPAYKSETIRGGQPAVPIKVDIQGARGLVLLVSFADRGDSWDHANWLNARLVKSAQE